MNLSKMLLLDYHRYYYKLWEELNSKGNRLVKGADLTQVEMKDSFLNQRLDWFKKRDETVLRLASLMREAIHFDEVFEATAAEITHTLNASQCQITIDLELRPLSKQFVSFPAAFHPLQESGSSIESPITFQNERLGQIIVFDQSQRQWLPEETTFLEIIAGEFAGYLNSIRLKVDLQYKSWEASQLRNIIQLISDERDPHLLAQRLTEHLIQLLDAEQGWVGYLYENAIIVTQYYKGGEWHPIYWHLSNGEGAAGTAVTQKKPYICHHCATDPLINSDYIDKFDCETILAVPIMSDQHIFGAIEIHNKKEDKKFEQEDIRSARMIAYQAAFVIERQKLFAEMAHRANALETLLKVSAQLNQQLNPSTLIQSLIRHSTNLVGASGGLGGLFDGQKFDVNSYWYQGAWHVLDIEALNLATWVIEHNQPLILQDYANDEKASSSIASTYQIRNALCIPILDLNDEPIGFLEVHNKMSAEAFTIADIEMMESLANTAAVALGNSYLFKELDRQSSQLRALSAQLVTVLEDERHRIAHELHDEAGQLLVGIKLNLRILANQLPNELQTAVEQLRLQVNQANEKLQALARGLRPPTLDELGLKAAIEKLIEDIAPNSGLSINAETAVSSVRLHQQIEIACYRIVQEALTNIIRHSKATKAWVSLVEENNTVTLKIKDNGYGFDIKKISDPGLGLLGMRERAASLGGHFDLISQIRKGTSILVTIPIPDSISDNEP